MPRIRPEQATISLGLYQHYKGGLYNIFGIAMDQSQSGHEEPLVLYSPVGSVHSDVDFYVRKLTEFFEAVPNLPNLKHPEERVPRFRKL